MWYRALKCCQSHYCEWVQHFHLLLLNCLLFLINVDEECGQESTRNWIEVGKTAHASTKCPRYSSGGVSKSKFGRDARCSPQNYWWQLGELGSVQSINAITLSQSSHECAKNVWWEHEDYNRFLLHSCLFSRLHRHFSLCMHWYYLLKCESKAWTFCFAAGILPPWQIASNTFRAICKDTNDNKFSHSYGGKLRHLHIVEERWRLLFLFFCCLRLDRIFPNVIESANHNP